MGGDNNCTNCHGPLIEIDYYGERLVGCTGCNLWRVRASLEKKPRTGQQPGLQGLQYGITNMAG